MHTASLKQLNSGWAWLLVVESAIISSVLPLKAHNVPYVRFPVKGFTGTQYHFMRVL